MSDSSRPIHVQIVSRYVPAANKAGHFMYVLDFMRYLHRVGCVLELIVLDPWCQEHQISPAVREIAHAAIRPPMLSTPAEPASKVPVFKSLLRPLYSRLPYTFLHPVRQTLYRLRGKPLPGIYKHDALATREEIAFTAARIIEFQPDVMIANHTYLGNLFEALTLNTRVLKTILTIHIESQRSEDFQDAGLTSHDSRWDREKESRQLQYADVLLAIQKDDAALLQQMAPHSEVICAPMSATLYTHDAAEQVPGRCLFVASDIDHNVHGLRWFLDQVWPDILRAVPDCCLHVCGSVCAKISGTYPQVALLGRVDDVAREYAAAEVCLIPLIVGSGLKIKLVEALSHGRACVSTTVGIQGVPELSDQTVIVADTPQDFAAAVVTLLKNPEKRRALEAQARQYVVETLAPEKVYGPFVDRIYQHLRQNNC